jgi:hypothetical protein
VPRILHVDADGAVATEANIVLITWFGAPTLPVVEAMHRATARLAAEHPTGIAHFNVVRRAAPDKPPQEDVRRILLGMLRDPSLHLVASALVYAEQGFLAASIRGVLAGLALFARPTTKLRFFGSIEDAERWLRRTLLDGGSSAPADGEIVAAARALQAELIARGARV